MNRVEELLIESECQRVIHQFYRYVDHHEFEKAVKLFTEDVTWKIIGVSLKGRDQLLEALYGALGKDTIRHVCSNTIVKVIDEDNADLSNYTSIYYSREGRREDIDGPLDFLGMHRLVDEYAKMKRVDGEWQIASREAGRSSSDVRTNRRAWNYGRRRKARQRLRPSYGRIDRSEIVHCSSELLARSKKQKCAAAA